MPPLWQEFNEAPHLEGGSHLYALGSHVHPRLFKTGSGKDPFERLQSEERKHRGRLQLFLAAIWWHEGHLEHLARRYLRERPASELAIQGIEYRMTCVNEIKEATDAARQRYRAQSRARATGDSEEAQYKRRRLNLQLLKEEFAQEKTKRDYELAMLQRELAVEEQSFDLEKRRSSWRRSEAAGASTR